MALSVFPGQFYEFHRERVISRPANRLRPKMESALHQVDDPLHLR